MGCGKWRIAAVILVSPALALGYFAGNPENLGANVTIALSGAGSVHGRHIPSSSSLAKPRKIVLDAAHLFAAPRKGPRADRYVMLTRSSRGLEQEKKVASIAVTGKTPTVIKAPAVIKAPLANKVPEQADMTVTGSTSPIAPVNLSSMTESTPLSVRPDPIAGRAREFGLLPAIPVSQRTSASVFLSSLTRSNAPQFPEMATQAETQLPKPGPVRGKISRSLKFKGETENEYQARQRRCLATAIYFEARGESIKGQLAVAQVVMNRVRTTLYPDTICGVVFQGQWRRTGCQFSFTCDGRADVPKDKEKWHTANELAKQVTDGESWLGDIGHATHYHANYVKPRWRREMNRIKQVGRHIFYRVRGEQIKDVLKEENPARGLALSGNG